MYSENNWKNQPCSFSLSQIFLKPMDPSHCLIRPPCSTAAGLVCVLRHFRCPLPCKKRLPFAHTSRQLSQPWQLSWRHLPKDWEAFDGKFQRALSRWALAEQSSSSLGEQRWKSRSDEQWATSLCSIRQRCDLLLQMTPSRLIKGDKSSLAHLDEICIELQ